MAGCFYTCLHLSPFLLHLSPLVSHLSRPTLDTHGRVFLHLSPLVPLPVSLLVCSWPDDFTHVSLLVYLLVSLFHLSRLVLAYCGCPSPDVFTLVSACLFACSMLRLRHSWPNDFTLVSHWYPCLSPFLLSLPPLASDYVGYTWPELSPACLQLRHSWPEALTRMHLSPLVFLLVSMLGHSLVTLVPTCPPDCLPCCFTCLPACLTSQSHGGLKAFNIFSQTKHDKAKCQHNSAY